MTNLQPCPFCGNQPNFGGDAADWKDDNRYVQLSLGCCVQMNETIGWRKARDMTLEARTAELKARLIERWNTREEAQPAAAEPVTDEHIDAVTHKWMENCYGNPLESHRRFARTILALAAPAQAAAVPEYGSAESEWHERGYKQGRADEATQQRLAAAVPEAVDDLKGLLRSAIPALEVLSGVSGLQPFLPGLPGLIERSKEAVK